MTPFPLTRTDGYKSQTFAFKSGPDGDIYVDVVYPEESDGSPSTVLIHYHGGFLLEFCSPINIRVFGDRYSFLPYWLVHASISRKWIFVTPNYRLIPESTGHSSVEDAVDAYKWVRATLPNLIARPISSVLMAGSSAGGYLALTVASIVDEKPNAVLCIYGMLDPAGPTYTTPGPNIFGRPPIETAPLLQEFPRTKENETRKRISGHPMPANLEEDRRSGLVSALHLEGLYTDYLTGVDGLGRAIADKGVDAIPEEHRHLFPLSFAKLANLPRTMLLHGVKDSAVPVACSLKAAERLRAEGVEVVTEFPDEVDHGFDARAGNVNVEGPDGDNVAAVESLRNAVRFLHSSVEH